MTDPSYFGPATLEAPRSTSARRSLQVRAYESLQDLQSLRPAWDDLLSAIPDASTFSTWEWLAPWWRAFGGGQQLMVLACFDESSRLVGLAPLALQRKRLRVGLEFRVVHLMGDGSGDSDNLDVLARRGWQAEVASAVVGYLDTQAQRWDSCQLNTLPDDSPCGSALLEQIRQRGWTYYNHPQPRSVVVMPDTWETYAAKLSPKERGKLRYYSRRLEKNHGVCFFRCATESDLPASLEALFQLHQKRWRARGGPGTFSSLARRRFYYEMSSALLARKRLEFWLLDLDGKTVAAQFGFRHGDTVYQLQEGFDPEYSGDSVGFVLRGRVIEQLIGEGVRRYDFLLGEGPDKARWGARLLAYNNLHFARPFTRGDFYLRFLHDTKACKEWLRTHLPDPAWVALHRLNLRLGRMSRESALEASTERRTLDVCVWEDMDSLRSLVPRWEELLSEFPGASTFSTWDWLEPWWHAFSASRKLYALSFHGCSPRLEGLALLARCTIRVAGGMPLRVLRLMGDGSGDSDNLDLPVRPGREQDVVRTLLDYLERESNLWDLCRFRTMPSLSPAGNVLAQELKRRKWTRLIQSPNWAAVELPDTWEDYLKQLTSKERRKVGLRTRRLERRYNVRYIKCSENELDPALNAFFRLHQERWRRLGEPGAFALAERRQFYRELARRLLKRGVLEFWLLELNGQTVAAQFAFRYGKTVFSSQEGFDPAYSSDSVGYVLRAHVLKQLIADGVRRYDFLAGQEEAKTRWGARLGHYLDIDFARPHTAGSLYLEGLRLATATKKQLRARLPQPAWSVLHRLNVKWAIFPIRNPGRTDEGVD